MYQLTVEAAASLTVTDHPDRAAAHGQLMRRVVTGDYYLRTVQTGPVHSTYELLVLSTDRRRPRSAGHAIIEELSAETWVENPEHAAADAARWIEHHRRTWECGADDDSGAGYPLAVLTAARAEARHWFDAGTLLPEAARLAGVAPIPRPSQQLLEALRRNATAPPRGGRAEPADRVRALLTAPTSSATLAALIWWSALLSWGATAS